MQTTFLMMLGLTAYLIDVELIECLIDVHMRWTLGTTDVPIEGSFHEIIALGVGFIDKKRSTQKFDPKKTSVYLSERLVVLSLSGRFSKNTNGRRGGHGSKRSVRNALNNSSLGFIFEEVALLVLMDYFGGMFSTLGDAFFHCSKLLSTRKGYLSIAEAWGRWPAA